IMLAVLNIAAYALMFTLLN
ncbi:conjugal transfer protein TrbE, partial [Salmonella enterica]